MGEILQAALDQTMEKYPLFQAVLRKRAVLVLSGAQRHQGSGKAGDGTTMQPFIYSG